MTELATAWPERHGEAGNGASWVARALLAAFAVGIPLDVLLATRFGSASLVLGVPLAAAACWQVLLAGRIRRAPTALLLATAFAIWAGLSVFWARDEEALQIRAKTLVQLLLFVWLAWQILLSERDVRALLLGFLGGCAYTVLGVWLAYLSGEAYLGGTRYAAEAYDPNDMAVTLAIGIPIAAYLAVARRRWRDAPLLAYVPLAISAIVLSGSRAGSLTALTAIVCVLVWTCRRGSWAMRGLVLAVVVVGAAFAWSYVPEDPMLRIFTVREELRGGSMGDRVQIWRAGLRVLADHPAFGIGAGGFAAAVGAAVGAEISAHSTPLSVLVELGAIGAVLFLGAFAAVLRRASDPAARALAWSLVLTWFVGSSSLTWEHRKTTWFVLLVAAAVGALRSPPDQRGAR